MTAGNRPNSRGGARIHPDGGSPPAENARPSTGSAEHRAAVLFRARSVRRPNGQYATAEGRVEQDEEVKHLNEPAEEHAAWLAERVRVEGRESAGKLLRFYGRMLIPVCWLSLLFFAVFASLSWAIPNLLCNEVAKQNSAAAFGIAECIYNSPSEGGWGVRTGAKVWWLFFWAVYYIYSSLFPIWVCWLMFHRAFHRIDYLWALLPLVGQPLMVIIVNAGFGFAVNHYGVLLASTFIFGVYTITFVSNIARRYTGNYAVGSRYWLFTLAGGLFVMLYKFYLPMLITARSGDAMGGMGLAVVRVLVHPTIWAVVLMWFRSVMRNIGHVPEMSDVMFLCWPLLYASCYGRFLLLQLEGVGSVIVMNLVFACFELAGKLGDRASDGLILKVLFGERGRDALTATRDHDDRHTAEVFTTLLMEMCSIFAASAIMSLGGVALIPGVGPDHKIIWINAAAQAVTTVVFAFLGLVLEGKYHNFEWERSWSKDRRRLTYALIAVGIMGGAPLCVELMGLFCPVYYAADDKILMEMCDKPSLFQAITFATSERFKMAGEFFNVTQSVGGINEL